MTHVALSDVAAVRSGAEQNMTLALLTYERFVPPGRSHAVAVLTVLSKVCCSIQWRRTTCKQESPVRGSWLQAGGCHLTQGCQLCCRQWGMSVQGWIQVALHTSHFHQTDRYHHALAQPVNKTGHNWVTSPWQDAVMQLVEMRQEQ